MTLAEHCRKRTEEERAKLAAEAEQQRLLKEKQERELQAKKKKRTVFAMIAAALINSDPFEHNTAEFIGDSFRELTRIAKMNESLWSELMLNNRDSLLEVMDAFEANFATLKKAVIEQNQVLLEKEFIESTERRLNLEATDQATGHAAVRGK